MVTCSSRVTPEMDEGGDGFFICSRPFFKFAYARNPDLGILDFGMSKPFRTGDSHQADGLKVCSAL